MSSLRFSMAVAKPSWTLGDFSKAPPSYPHVLGPPCWYRSPWPTDGSRGAELKHGQQHAVATRSLYGYSSCSGKARVANKKLGRKASAEECHGRNNWLKDISHNWLSHPHNLWIHSLSYARLCRYWGKYLYSFERLYPYFVSHIPGIYGSWPMSNCELLKTMEQHRW